MINLQRLDEALETLKQGLSVEPENEALLGLVTEVESEIKFDSNLPEDHPLKIKFNSMFEWL